MLKKFAVKNYKNFKDEIVLDFSKVGSYQFSADCLTAGFISKMLIYGRNATGKTNFIRAISDIQNLVLDLPYLNRISILNADSDQDKIDFTYVFSIDKQEITYNYSRLSNGALAYEEMLLDGKRVFVCDFEKDQYNFSGLFHISAETLNSDLYLDLIHKKTNANSVIGNTVPFLRWIVTNTVLKEYSILRSFFEEVLLMFAVLTHGNGIRRNKIDTEDFFKKLENNEELIKLERFLNDMGVCCRLTLKKLPDGSNELYFGQNKRLVPFYATASSGTLALLNLYRRIFVGNIEPSVLLLDEFDAFYHYEMAENLVKYLKNHYRQTQIILTTHNTNLMNNSLMRPDCLFILSRDGRLTPLNKATQRELREGHNLEKMYISGEFEKYE